MEFFPGKSKALVLALACLLSNNLKATCPLTCPSTTGQPSFCSLAVTGPLTAASLCVAGNESVGGNLNVCGTLTASGISISSTAASTSCTNGALVVTGGVGIGGNLNVCGTETISNTGASTSCTNGALVVAGGVGIGGNLNVCGTETIFSTGASTSCTNGALVVAGGVGVGGDLNVCGFISASGFTGVSVGSSAQYVQLGSQPATVGAGQPFTYTTAVLTSSDVIATTAVFNPPFTTSGTIFTLATIGRYEVNYQMVYPTDGGVVLYFGSTIAGMLPLPYTMIGKNPNGAVSGSVIIETTTPNSFLSVNAAAGNAAAIGIPPNSSTTNQSATTVSIKRIS